MMQGSEEGSADASGLPHHGVRRSAALLQRWQRAFGPQRYSLHLALFVVTFFTTTVAGVAWSGRSSDLYDIGDLHLGVSYAALLLLFLSLLLRNAHLDWAIKRQLMFFACLLVERKSERERRDAHFVTSQGKNSIRHRVLHCAIVELHERDSVIDHPAS